MSANRIHAHFNQQPVATLPAVLVSCAAPVAVLVMVRAPLEPAAVQRQIYELAWERARVALKPPRHLRLLENMN